MDNHYITLDVSENATQDEIKKAFHKLSKECHPDLHSDDPNAKGKFQKLQGAYSDLKDQKSRPKHDFELSAEKARRAYQYQQQESVTRSINLGNIAFAIMAIAVIIGVVVGLSRRR